MRKEFLGLVAWMRLDIVKLKGGRLLDSGAADLTHLYFGIEVLGVVLLVLHGVVALHGLVPPADDLRLVDLSFLGLLWWVELHLVLIFVTWLSNDQTAF